MAAASKSQVLDNPEVPGVSWLHFLQFSSVQFSSEMFVYCRIDSTDNSLL